MGVRSILGKKREEIREAKQKKPQGKIAELAWRRKKIRDVRPRSNEKRWHLDKCRQKVLTLLALLESELIATPLK
jgi:hypothetical protein